MIKGILHRLSKDSAGNSTIELALVTPILLTMALAGIDLTLGFVHRMEVQQHAQIGADVVNSSLEDVPLAADVRQEIRDASGVDVTKIKIEEWIECDGVVKKGVPFCTNPTAVQTAYMKIEVSDDFTPILNIKGYADYAQKTTHTGSVTVRTM